jgi:hypothetical protein
MKGYGWDGQVVGEFEKIRVNVCDLIIEIQNWK